MFREQDSIRVSEAGEAIGVARSTAHRLLAMLQYHGFVVQDESSRAYRAGPALVDVGLSVVRHMDIREQARPHLERLAQDVAETVHLAVLRGSDVVFVDSVETTRAVRVGSRTGASMPAHCTAAGKALLAALSASQLRDALPAGRIKGLTPSSVTTRADLEKQLGEIRDRGFATNMGESESDVAAVAQAVHDRQGAARGSVTISAPISRLDREGIQDLVGPLQTCVASIEADLR
jgi:DNA-binding IclR family transcriptional regulator